MIVFVLDGYEFESWKKFFEFTKQQESRISNSLKISLKIFLLQTKDVSKVLVVQLKTRKSLPPLLLLLLNQNVEKLVFKHFSNPNRTLSTHVDRVK
jgi:hypothetical protein